MSKLIIEIYRTKKREYRWRMKRCGRIVAESGESYKRRKPMIRTITNMVDSLEAKNYSVYDFTFQ